MDYASEFRRLSDEVERHSRAQQGAAAEVVAFIAGMRRIMTQQQVADELGISRQRVGQLEAKGRKTPRPAG